jgi:hypothetical protein
MRKETRRLNLAGFSRPAHYWYRVFGKAVLGPIHHWFLTFTRCGDGGAGTGCTIRSDDSRKRGSGKRSRGRRPQGNRLDGSISQRPESPG